MHSRRRAHKVVRAVQALALPWRPTADVLITIDPETSLAAFLATRGRAAWVADVHEDYASLLRDRAWVPMPLLKVLQGAVRLLTRLIARADLVLVADEHVPPGVARSRYVMRNEPDFSLLPEPGEMSDEAPWRAIYIGDNRETRGLRTMVEAVAATSGDEEPWTLDLVGPVADTDRDWLAERLTQPDARRITSHGRQEPLRAWRVAEGADVGLCLLADTPAFVEAMPSKVYEYQACGLPTIATPLPRVADLIRRTGAGTLVRDVPETTEALRRFATDPQWRAGLRAAAKKAAVASRAGHNTYDEAAARILELVHR
ncbi:Glycosyltransferase involved in cell wall bisynthesis [Tessaracoccus bendigoensis DSM 12906]|uniref:Glycosyltransferase involved in cell wall bisynthesis n=1 Tax=Tessaracoccus bendigoensis DSM 12906 TaxID=1123357 RepID=A0A1M6DIB0_9ACTN|nr:glycosyltransferase [Tessaracoccus bendigoensis]SHI72853.1 Glycosyltransferase involved in cell wall bisynthesis [Tessaracoccus bendigoensis DSM 12906]